MRIGCTLPTFHDDAGEALTVAREAEEAGLDGVFVFDHLWPMGQPGRPALSSTLVLGAVAAVTQRLALGTLVARVCLRPDDVLLSELYTVDALSGGRLLAGLGTGDHKSDDEQRAYGLPVLPAPRRRRSLAAVAARLRDGGTEVWIGAGGAATNAVARDCGAVLNLWGTSAEAVGESSSDGPTSWGGPLPKSPQAAAEALRRLAEAGATWAVWAWPASVATVVETLRISRFDRT